MDYIQWASGIETLLSVITIVVAFLFNASNTRKFTIRKMRIEKMSQIISDFVEILETGDKTAQYVNRVYAKVQRETPKLYFESKEEYELRGPKLKESLDLADSKKGKFFAKVKNNIKIKQKLLFEVWAKDEEKDILKDILGIVNRWEDSNTTLDDLNKNISDKVFKLSVLLRDEVEDNQGFLGKIMKFIIKIIIVIIAISFFSDWTFKDFVELITTGLNR